MPGILSFLGKSSDQQSRPRVTLGISLPDKPDANVAQYLEASEAPGLTIERDDNGKQTLTLSSTASQVYFIHNGKMSDFKALSEGSGVPVPQDGGFQLKLSGRSSSGLAASVKVIEYGDGGKRLTTHTVRLGNTASVVRCSSQARYALIALRIAGEGTLTLDGFVVEGLTQAQLAAASADAKASARSAKAKSSTPAPASSAPRAAFAQKLAYTETHKAAGILEGAFDSIVQLVQRLEDGSAQSPELYKLKRQVTGWRMKYEDAVKNAPTPLARLNVDLLETLAESIPQSDGSRHHDRFALRIGIVTDLYMYNYYKDCCDEVVYLTPDNYEEELGGKPFDAFIYVTCWKGIDNEEWRGVKFREKPQNAMAAILDHCRQNGIPTIFQSIEDPSNYDYFLPIAQQFDHIFTSDTDVIERYKRDCGHEQVYYGEYGANPLLNNPIGTRRHQIDSYFFAGSYPARYQERCDDMEIMFDSIIENDGDLLIADRNYHSDDKSTQFPERYRNRCIPPVSHTVLQPMHKLFRFSINFNSIKASPTMCAMRIYELQAQGKLIYSNYAHSVFNKFPLVRIVAHRENLGIPLSHPELLEEYRDAMAAIRDVMTTRTSFDIVGQMLRTTGVLSEDDLPATKAVAVVVKSKSEKLAAMVEAQAYPAVVMIEEKALSSAKTAKALADQNVHYLTWFSEDHDYQRDYLTDLVNAFKYTNSRYVVRDDMFSNDGVASQDHHENIDVMPACDRTLFALDAFEWDELGAMVDGQSLEGGYCIDPFELDFDRYLQAIAKDAEAVDYRLSVIVPVHNNGRYLATKCIPSLMQNTLWPQMEVLLVDDGSTNDETRRITANLARNYANVSLFEYNDGGSGSASRPRNKGLEMATAPLVTFLDPDNEISLGGYDRLVELFDDASQSEEGPVDFVSGYQVKVTETTGVTGRHAETVVRRVNDLRGQFFDRGKFPVISTQAAVMRRSLFEDGSFRFIERAAGQDTLFGWELACRSNSAIFTPDVQLIYFAGRDGSVTNMTDVRYFEKMLIMEAAQVEALERHGLLDMYREKHFARFWNEWYLEKFVRVPFDQRPKAGTILEKIATLYGYEKGKFVVPDHLFEAAGEHDERDF